MKLLCANLNIFEKNNPRIEKFFLEHNDIDILCLQEVTRSEDPLVDVSLMSKKVIDNNTQDLKYNFFSPKFVMDHFEVPNFHGEKLFRQKYGGFMEYGTYMKSRYEIYRGKSVFVQGQLSYETDWSQFPEKDSRDAQVVDIETPQGRLRVINYHGIWSQNKQGSDLTKEANNTLKRLALEVDHPSIICGDFNLFPNTDSMRLFEDHFENLMNTYNVETTRIRSNELSKFRNVVDYILIRKDLRVEHFEVIKTDLSDHLPLLIHFELS